MRDFTYVGSIPDKDVPTDSKYAWAYGQAAMWFVLAASLLAIGTLGRSPDVLWTVGIDGFGTLVGAIGVLTLVLTRKARQYDSTMATSNTPTRQE